MDRQNTTEENRNADKIAEMEKVGLYLSGFKSALKKDPAEALIYLNKATDLSEKINFKKGIAKSLYCNGEYYLYLSDYHNAETSLLNALEKASAIKEEELISDILHLLGNAHYSLGYYQKSLEDYFKSLDLRKKKEGNEMQEANTLNNIGIVFRNMNIFPSALEYYLKSLEIKEKFGNERAIASTMNNIGLILNSLGEYDKSNEYMFKSLKLISGGNDIRNEAKILNNIGMNYKFLNNYDEAFSYYTKSYSLYKSVNDDNEAAFVINNLGTIYSLKEDDENAIKQFDEGIAISRKTGEKKSEASGCLNKGISLTNLGKIEEAEKSIQEAIVIARKFVLKDILALCYSSLSETYYKKNKFKEAFEMFREFREIEVEIFNETSMAQTRSLIIHHDAEQLKKETNIIKEKNKELFKVINRLDEINEEKNSILGIVAHDLRDPVSAIYSLSELTLNDYDTLDKEEVKEFISNIKTSSDKALQILSSLLNLNAIESGNYELNFTSFDVKELIRIICSRHEEYAASKNIKLILDTAFPFIVYADKNSVDQIFTNLISNAIKYSPFDKTVTIIPENNYNFIRIKIKDDGPGFSEKDRSKLFEKFARLSAKPTGGEQSIGLGLSIVKKLIELNNGTITLESKEGKGAVFSVNLPKILRK